MVKSTKFAIAGAKRKKRNFIEICHTQVEITASKFPMAAIRNSGTPQLGASLGETTQWGLGSHHNLGFELLEHCTVVESVGLVLSALTWVGEVRVPGLCLVRVSRLLPVFLNRR